MRARSGSVPIPILSRSRSRPGTNGHAPTCQFEFPTAPSHWAPRATPTPLKKPGGTTPAARLLVERRVLPRFYWLYLLSIMLPSRPCAALHRLGGATSAQRREERAGSSWERRFLIGCNARRSYPTLRAHWSRRWAGWGRCGPVRETGQRAPAAGGRPAAGGGSAAPR